MMLMLGPCTLKSHCFLFHYHSYVLFSVICIKLSHTLDVFPELHILTLPLSVFTAPSFSVWSAAYSLWVFSFLQHVNTSEKFHPLMQPEFSFACDALFCRNGELGIIHEEHKKYWDFLLLHRLICRMFLFFGFSFILMPLPFMDSDFFFP